MQCMFSLYCVVSSVTSFVHTSFDIENHHFRYSLSKNMYLQMLYYCITLIGVKCNLCTYSLPKVRQFTFKNKNAMSESKGYFMMFVTFERLSLKQSLLTSQNLDTLSA